MTLKEIKATGKAEFRSFIFNDMEEDNGFQMVLLPEEAGELMEVAKVYVRTFMEETSDISDESLILKYNIRPLGASLNADEPAVERLLSGHIVAIHIGNITPSKMNQMPKEDTVNIEFTTSPTTAKSFDIPVHYSGQ